LCAFHAAIGGDHAQRDCSHVWRVPGTLNWPTKSKIARGRSAEPAPVTVAKACNGARVELLALSPAGAARKPRKAKTGSSDASEKAHQSGPVNTADLPEFEQTQANAELLHRPCHVFQPTTGVAYGLVLAALRTLEPVWGARARAIADWWPKRSHKFDPVEQGKTSKSLNAACFLFFHCLALGFGGGGIMLGSVVLSPSR
jgi:hypothetical protein